MTKTIVTVDTTIWREFAASAYIEGKNISQKLEEVLKEYNSKERKKDNE